MIDLAQIENDAWAPTTVIGVLAVIAFVVGAAAALAWRVRENWRRQREAELERFAERDRFWELAPDMMCVADFEGIIRRVNPAVERTMGYRADELIGRPFMELVHPEDQENAMRDLAEASEGRQVFESVNRFRHKDGRYLWLTWNTQPELASGVFFAVGHDVSGRVVSEAQQKAQEAILEQLSRLQQAILDSSDYTIVTTDPHGVITSFNPAAERMFGYRAAEVVNLKTPSIFHVPSELGRVAAEASERLGRPVDANMQVFKTLAQPGVPYEAEWTFRRKDGSTFPALLTVTALQDGVGRVTGLLGVARDITQQKADEAELHHLLERFTALAELAPVGIFMTDAHGSVIYFNEMYETLSGRPSEQAMGNGWARAIHPDDRPMMTRLWREAVELGHGIDTEFRFERTDGAVIEGRVVSTPLRDRHGTITGHIGTTWDITAEKREREALERAVAERTSELTETNRQLNREVAERHEIERRAAMLRDQLTHVARLSTMGELAAGLAHELNQPLGAIANYTQGLARMIEAGATDDRQVTEMLTKVADQAHRAGQIIQRLRNFVANREPKRQSTDVNRLVREVAELLEHDARHGNVDVVTDMADGLPAVSGDPVQLQQVILNLMRNAMEAMLGADSPTKRLTVRTRSGDDDGGRVTIEVIDSGPGCSDEQIARLFDAFYTTKEAGMGLGLSISQTIVRAHEGRLWAGRNPDGGMTFGFSLPVQEAETHGQGTQIQQAERA